MRVAPLTGVLGAEIEGIDLAALDDAGFAELRAALDRFGVIRVAGGELDAPALAQLTRRFGPLFIHPLVDNKAAENEAVLSLTREPGDETVFGGEGWHADVTWLKPEGAVSVLHALETPEAGGDTAFASSTAAFEALSEGMKATLRGLIGVNAYHWYERREDPAFTARHPVVRRLASGREALYLDTMFTCRFEGWSVEDSAPLIRWLHDWRLRPEFTCRIRWRPGDTAIWDNRAVVHYPIHDAPQARRRMIRATAMAEDTR